MARLVTILVALLAVPAGFAQQQQQDEQFKKAGVCARCHVISVVEWGMSRHSHVATDCLACHGKSEGHVIDERNNVKPERIPHGAAVAALCAGCHSEGCPKTKQKTGCETCHHVHALVNPNQPPAVRNEALEKRTVQWERYTRQMAAGEQAMKARQWQAARAALLSALKESPGDRRANELLRACERRISGRVPGFDNAGGAFDDATGLPREVRVSGIGIPMVLASGGDVDLGSDRFANARPVHTVSVKPFYLGKYEVTQAEWTALMGSNPSLPKGDRLPVNQISWEDAQAFIKKLNEKVPGAGFRLPTEAEWEFAARAGAVAGASLSDVACFDQTGAAAGPQPVGSRKPNQLGIYDLQGNVWEWTSSLAKPYPFDASDGRESPDAAGLRILRGGGYADSADLLDPAMRHAERPNRAFRWNGLRLARSVPD
jgi:sulfatase modifying factor 1